MVSENVQQAGGWRLRWLALMYTVQGLPYGLQVGLLPAGLRASGYSLSAVSLSRLLFLPWLCKPFIAPIVERSRRTWLLGSLMSLTAMFIVAAILPGHVGVDLHHQREQAGVPTSLMHLMPLLLMLNTFAAAHDVVVDGCAVTMLKGNAELGQGNAVQVVFYKLGSLFSGGVLLWALPALTWPGAMLCLAFSCAVASAISFRYPSNGSRVFRGTSKLGGPPVGVHDVIMGADMRWMAAFVLFYKLGEQGSQSTFPLLLLDRGFNTKELGLYISSPATILSLISSSLAAPLLASYRIVSMVRWVLHLRLAPLIGQNLLLTFAPLRFDTLHKAIAVTTILVEHLAGGLLTTLTFTLMMRCVQGMSKHLQATCFSTLSALELLGKLVFASISGIVLDGIGTGPGFLLFLLLAGLPLLLLRHIH